MTLFGFVVIHINLVCYSSMWVHICVHVPLCVTTAKITCTQGNYNIFIWQSVMCNKRPTIFRKTRACRLRRLKRSHYPTGL